MPRKKSETALAPDTKPAEPQASRIITLPVKAGSTRVTEDTALKFSAVWGCIRFISEGLATLPLHCFRKRPKGGADVESGTVDWLIDQQANPETSAFIFRETIIAHAISWGNGYAEIERDGGGRVAWLWQLAPDRVRVERFHGRIIYDVWNPFGPNTALEAEDVVHLKGLGFDGLVGYPVIRLAAHAIAAGMSAQEGAANFFANDSTPGGILKHPMRLSETAAKNLRTDWQARHGGANNRRTVAILEEGMTWEQTGLPPEDAQLVENMQFSVTDIARWFRVPPHKIGDLSKSSFNNIEAENLSAVIDCLMPWAVRFESECNLKLFGRMNRGTLFCKHNFKGRLRGDTAAQTNHVTQMMDRGVYSVNDARDYLDLNPIGPEGDKRYFPLNYTLLEKVGEDPPETPQPDPAPQDVPNPKGENNPNMSPFQGWLEQNCGRIARREMIEVKRAKDRKAGKDWIGKFLTEHIRFMRDELTPPMLAVAAALNRTEVALAIVEQMVKYTDATMREELPHILENGSEWKRDDKNMAASLLQMIQGESDAKIAS